MQHHKIPKMSENSNFMGMIKYLKFIRFLSLQFRSVHFTRACMSASMLAKYLQWVLHFVFIFSYSSLLFAHSSLLFAHSPLSIRRYFAGVFFLLPNIYRHKTSIFYRFFRFAHLFQSKQLSMRQHNSRCLFASGAILIITMSYK